MAWIFDIDHGADPKAKTGTNSNAVGIIGPRSYKGDGSDCTFEFRMLDDDRQLVYEGRSKDDSDFGPLEDFGTPNYGCTIIQYRVNGAWADL